MNIYEKVVSFIPTASDVFLTDEGFSTNIKTYIAQCLSTLNQNGVGKIVNMDDNPTWDDFFGEDAGKNRADAISYVCMKTHILFDPPAGNALTYMEKLIEECLFRARLEYE